MNWDNSNTVEVAGYNLPNETLLIVKKLLILLDTKKTLVVWYKEGINKTALSQLREICKEFNGDIVMQDDGTQMFIALRDAAHYVDLTESEYAIA